LWVLACVIIALSGIMNIASIHMVVVYEAIGDSQVSSGRK